MGAGAAGGTAAAAAVAAALWLAAHGAGVAGPPPGAVPEPTAAAWSPGWLEARLAALPDDAWGRAVRRGRDLVTGTYAAIGPEVAEPSRRYAGNNLACGNCHLSGGTKPYGLGLVGVFADFPRYRARNGAVVTLEDRINGCMERSMNGQPLPAESPDLVAIAAYLRLLSEGVPVGAASPGRGSGALAEPARPADTERGAAVYAATCAACHGAEGQGQRRGTPGDRQGYAVPPLWGPDSYNDGAGMARVGDLANFAYSNMPDGASHGAPVLAPEDAWDVAAFVDSRPRPHRQGLERDFPNRLEKPVDVAYGPYADGFNETQHKYGPFAPIREQLRVLRAAAATTPGAGPGLPAP